MFYRLVRLDSTWTTAITYICFAVPVLLWWCVSSLASSFIVETGDIGAHCVRTATGLRATLMVPGEVAGKAVRRS